MDLKEIRALIDLMKKNDLTEFALEREGFKIKLRKGWGREPQVEITERPAFSPQASPAAPAGTPPAAPAPAAGSDITSPMVGTFYSSASPDMSAFVEVGAEVTEETVVCIIVAMKQFNEIRAEKKGTITAILAENGKPVDYGQPLFRIV